MLDTVLGLCIYLFSPSQEPYEDADILHILQGRAQRHGGDLRQSSLWVPTLIPFAGRICLDLLGDETVLFHHTCWSIFLVTPFWGCWVSSATRGDSFPTYLRKRLQLSPMHLEIDFPLPQTWGKYRECVLDVPIICTRGQVDMEPESPQTDEGANLRLNSCVGMPVGISWRAAQSGTIINSRWLCEDGKAGEAPPCIGADEAEPPVSHSCLHTALLSCVLDNKGTSTWVCALFVGHYCAFQNALCPHQVVCKNE